MTYVYRSSSDPEMVYVDDDPCFECRFYDNIWYVYRSDYWPELVMIDGPDCISEPW